MLTHRRPPTESLKTPQPGELWDFKFGRGHGATGSRPSYPPAKVIEVRDGWVRYAIGQAHPDLSKPIQTFTYLYLPSHR